MKQPDLIDAFFGLLFSVILSGCGGGQMTTDEIAQHDADVQALAHMTIQPVNCAASGVCK